jgi:hypothetical protein
MIGERDLKGTGVSTAILPPAGPIARRGVFALRTSTSFV